MEQEVVIKAEPVWPQDCEIDSERLEVDLLPSQLVETQLESDEDIDQNGLQLGELLPEMIPMSAIKTESSSSMMQGQAIVNDIPLLATNGEDSRRAVALSQGAVPPIGFVAPRRKKLSDREKRRLREDGDRDKRRGRLTGGRGGRRRQERLHQDNFCKDALLKCPHQQQQQQQEQQLPQQEGTGEYQDKFWKEMLLKCHQQQLQQLQQEGTGECQDKLWKEMFLLRRHQQLQQLLWSQEELLWAFHWSQQVLGSEDSRKERERQRMRRARASESKDKAERRREARRLYMRQMRASLTPEQIERRREQGRLRMRRVRAYKRLKQMLNCAGAVKNDRQEQEKGE